ncbi:MAG: CRISPR-associated helicase Cas3' [Acidobacteria bacterium]|nr:CRISPR-associated helicase Cas3' [Acidobacteriota bacterium]
MTPRDDRYYAHSAPSDTAQPWHGLADHLRETGDRAAQSLERLGVAELGRVAGLLHDLGKYTPEFQKRLRGGPSVNHSTAGAQIACERYPGHLGKLIAFCVAGHHAGLANGVNGEKITALADRLRQQVPRLDSVWCDEIAVPPLAFPRVQLRGPDSVGFTASFLIRLVFSALVDADYLDTEAYYDAANGSGSLRGEHPSLNTLRQRLDSHLGKFNAKARTPVNELRAEILAHARSLADKPPGLFTLTVPTGGGKTLTSLAFALDHAVRHGLDRVIYVIPYTNIIEQTADVFRAALAETPDAADFVIEHHSAFDDDRIKGRSGRDKLRLAMENWNAPIVVTTAVQFFESLFANRTSRCRKLHNIAGSVVVLDETQTLPLGFLRPCVAAIDELARNWRASVVLSSATQPALAEESGFAGGLREVHELAPEPVRLQERLRRIRLHPQDTVSEDELADRLRETPQVLCIVNTRRRARVVYEAIRDHEGATHLTTLMCARHRRQVLASVRQRLKAAGPIRLIATSLVEAGVDLDFPVVWREESGLESIIQAAGRCNREGRATSGDVFVFRFPAEGGGSTPPGIGMAASAARGILRKHADPMSLQAIREYFQTLYWARGKEALDKNSILPMLAERGKSLDFPFETIAREFRLIETAMVPVIVSYRGPDGADRAVDGLIKELDFAERPGALARRLQPYTVPIPTRARATLMSAGSVRIVQEAQFGEQFVVLDNEDLYRDDIGLTWDDPTFRHTEGMVI